MALQLIVWNAIIEPSILFILVQHVMGTCMFSTYFRPNGLQLSIANSKTHCQCFLKTTWAVLLCIACSDLKEIFFFIKATDLCLCVLEGRRAVQKNFHRWSSRWHHRWLPAAVLWEMGWSCRLCGYEGSLYTKVTSFCNCSVVVVWWRFLLFNLFDHHVIISSNLCHVATWFSVMAFVTLVDRWLLDGIAN